MLTVYEREPSLSKKKFLRQLVLASLSGVLLFLSFPPLGFWPLVWVALVPFFAGLDRITAFPPRACLIYSALYGYLTGFVFFAGLLYWIARVEGIGSMGYPAWLVLSLFQGSFFALFSAPAGLFFSYTDRPYWRTLFAGSMFVVAEFLRSLGFFGFTWGSLCYSQVPFLPILQFAEFTGMYGITFVIIWMNVYLAELFLRKVLPKPSSLVWDAAGLLPFAVCLFFGLFVLRQPVPQPDIKLALIQTGESRNVEWSPEEEAKLMNDYKRLSFQAVKKEKDVQLVAFPESFNRWRGLEKKEFYQTLYHLSRQLGVTLAVGTFSSNRQGDNFTGAAVFSPEGRLLGTYEKVHLTPLGERVPDIFQRFFRKLNYDPWQAGEFPYHTPGKSFKVIQTPLGPLGFNVCIETIFPEISRRLMQNGAQILIGLATDSYYLLGEYEQHAAMFVLRAVENRVWLARCADTGISYVANPLGEITHSTKPKHEAALVAKVGRNIRKTFYTQHGFWFVGFCIFLAFCSFLGCLASLSANSSASKSSVKRI